jgi:hypothetical protein
MPPAAGPRNTSAIIVYLQRFALSKIRTRLYPRQVDSWSRDLRTATAGTADHSNAAQVSNPARASLVVRPILAVAVGPP